MKKRQEKRKVPFKIGQRLNARYNSVVRGTYLSYVPDKYYDNFVKYRNNFYPFFQAEDIDKWVKGNYVNNAGDLTRFYFLNLVIDQLLFEKIEGDIAEFGVYKGNSAFLLTKFSRIINKITYLFDTFEGFDKKDIAGHDKNISQKEFSDTSLDYVKDIAGTENVQYIKGYFPDSLSQLEHKDDLRFCLVHIDCDLEIPFMHSLQFFYPRMVPGGFLVMHDYSSLYWDGARNAINTFLADKQEKLVPIPDKSGTVVLRKL